MRAVSLLGERVARLPGAINRVPGRTQRGSVILVTGFGSSSLLGFALVSAVFPDHDQAISGAIVLSAPGVQPFMFTLANLKQAADKAGMDEKTARKYRQA